MTKFPLAMLCCLFLLLAPHQSASAQSYTSTSSGISYNPDTNLVTLQAEWFYTIGSMQYWNFGAPNFDVSISKYTSQQNYNNGQAESTNLYNYVCPQGQWSQGAHSPGVGRVYGYKQLSLQNGYLYSITLVTPKTGYSSFQQYPSAPVYFVWSGQGQQPIVVDRLHPGDE